MDLLRYGSFAQEKKKLTGTRREYFYTYCTLPEVITTLKTYDVCGAGKQHHLSVYGARSSTRKEPASQQSWRHSNRMFAAIDERAYLQAPTTWMGLRSQLGTVVRSTYFVGIEPQPSRNIISVHVWGQVRSTTFVHD